jgi:hypothetical protein
VRKIFACAENTWSRCANAEKPAHEQITSQKRANVKKKKCVRGQKKRVMGTKHVEKSQKHFQNTCSRCANANKRVHWQKSIPKMCKFSENSKYVQMRKKTCKIVRMGRKHMEQ